MTDLSARTRARTTPTRPRPGLFRAFWRWHFYASFLVVPVLLVLATTGLIYLFRFQLEPLLTPDLLTAEAPSETTIVQPYAAQLAAVEREFPDATVLSMAEPREVGRPTVFSVLTAAGEGRDVYVNPYGAQVLGSQDPDGTVSGTAVRLHADLMSGHARGPGAGAGCLLGDRDGADRLLPVRPRPEGKEEEPGLRGEAALAARRGRLGGRDRPADAARLGTAVDRGVGRQGPADRLRPGLVAVEHRPGCRLRPRLDPRRVAAAQPRARGALGPGWQRGAVLGRRRPRRQPRQPRHRGRRRLRPGVAAPDDRGAAGLGRRGLLGDRLRVRRAVGRAHRPRRPATAARWCRRTASTTTRRWRRW